MFLSKQVRPLQAFLQDARQKGASVGFVPTMGALHQGHLSLINMSKNENERTVCSIFVNPTQFNEASDLDKYPRTPAKDINALREVGCEVLFMPSPGQIYPPGLDTTLDISFDPLDSVMEGAFREGHFDGVAQVVNRLLQIVQPDRLYMGQKDYQQFAIIQHMLQVQQSPVQLVMHPIVRETDGLAMSSRNVRLTPEHRSKAIILFDTLQDIKAKLGTQSVKTLEQESLQKLQIPGFRPEYVKIVDGFTLQDIEDPANHQRIVACIACWAGDVRLIDNLIIK